MKIRVMGYVFAMRHEPQVSTYVIRIFDSYPNARNSPQNPLCDSSLYTIQGYVFDDQDVDRLQKYYPDMDFDALGKKYVLFNKEIARAIIEDFDKVKDMCLELLVHCTLGGSRSPAVALALNDIFDLGQSPDEITRKRSTYNRFVYRLLMESQ